MNRIVPVMGLFSLGLLFTNAAPAQESSANRVVQPGKSRSENRIAREVRHELVMLPYYGVFDNLEFKVDGSKVTLSGEVTRPTLKSDAGNVIKNIEGVEEIVNNIKVLPLSSNDDRIRVAAFRAIYGQPGLDRYAIQAVPPIHLIVENGRIRLVGVVANEADKTRAGMAANGVQGAFGVENELRVESSEQK